jgi:hypothetical protein
MDSEFESMRAVLGKLPERTAPAGFTGKLMEEVGQIERRRIYRRLVLVLVLRSVVLVGLLLALVIPLVIHGFRIDVNWNGIGELEQAGREVLDHVYFLFPFVVLLFARRLFGIK